jgi:hypothetical protein
MCGSTFRQSNGDIILTAGSIRTIEDDLLEMLITRKIFAITYPLKPAIASKSSLTFAARRVFYPTGIWYGSSCISVRMVHASGTDANASQIEFACEDYSTIIGVTN